MRRWCARPGPPTPRTSDPKPPPPPTHDPIIGLGAVSLNKTPSASPPQRLSPSHGASRIRKRAGSPSHQEPLFPLQLTPRAERCQAGASLGGEHPNPLAHSAKADPPSQSLLSERRPDTAEPRPPEIPTTGSPLLTSFRSFIRKVRTNSGHQPAGERSAFSGTGFTTHPRF